MKPSTFDIRPFRPVILGRYFLMMLFFGAVSIGPVQAQDKAAPVLMIEDAVIASGVENLTVVGPGASFDAGVGRLFCFTKITTNHPPAVIKHLWFYGDKMVMEVSLPIKSENWRTYSAKTILPSAVGDWKVDVTSEDGTILKTLNFTIR